MSVDASGTYPKIFTFNSATRASGTNSSFTTPPVSLGTNDYDSVVLLQCFIPRTYYNMPAGATTFTLREQGLDATVTIPVGSYSKNSLQPVLQSLLNAASVSLGHTYSYTVSYPATNVADTYKFTYTVTGNSGNQPSFIFTGGSSSPYQQLGFGQNSTNTFVGNTITSTSCINLLGVNALFVTSNICQDAQNSILQGILSVGTTPFLGTIYFEQQNVDLGAKLLNMSNVNSWQFSLTDSFGSVVDLNGVPWSFSIMVFKRANTHELVKSNLMIENEDRLYNIAKQAEAAAKVDDNTLGPPPTVNPRDPRAQETPQLEDAYFGISPLGFSINRLLEPDIHYPSVKDSEPLEAGSGIVPPESLRVGGTEPEIHYPSVNDNA